MIGASSTARKHTRVADVDQLVEVDVVESGKRSVVDFELDSSAIESWCARWSARSDITKQSSSGNGSAEADVESRVQ